MGLVDPDLIAARKRSVRRRRASWAVAAFAAFFVFLALAIAAALIMRTANAL